MQYHVTIVTRLLYYRNKPINFNCASICITLAWYSSLWLLYYNCNNVLIFVDLKSS